MLNMMVSSDYKFFIIKIKKKTSYEQFLIKPKKKSHACINSVLYFLYFIF